MKNNANHSDCQNFIPIDVAKGYCNMLKANVVIDSPVCPKFAQVAKCKVCSKFGCPDEKGIGQCGGFKDEYWAYGEMKAVNCEMYQTK